MKEFIECFKLIFRKKEKWYLYFAGGVLMFAIAISLIFYGWFQMLKETNATDENNSEDVPNFGTEIGTEKEDVVPNFGTMVCIINLEKMAKPILEEDASCLEDELTSYVCMNNMDEKEASIIHVMVPENNQNQLFFFCQFSSNGEIVQVVFDRKKDVFITLKSYYSVEEIVNEVWNGKCPTDRDTQE